jgi:hypothetical protein
VRELNESGEYTALYRIHASSRKEIITGGSCFNIKAKSLRLDDFSRAEMCELYARHTAEREQLFTEHALAAGHCGGDRSGQGAAGGEPRQSHLDQLADKLKEDRVQRVVAPIIQGVDRTLDGSDQDVSYVVDLGLIKRSRQGARIANAIYREVIPRELTLHGAVQPAGELPPILVHHERSPPRYGEADRRLPGVFRENSVSWSDPVLYREWEQKIFRREEQHEGLAITVWGM